MIRRRYVLAAALALAVSLSMLDADAATSPFGIATPDSSGSYFGGPFGSFFAWIAVHQAHFYKALTSALGDLKADMPVRCRFALDRRTVNGIWAGPPQVKEEGK